MSVLVRARARDALRLAPLLVGLAACRAAERAAPGVSASLKWPNDVWLGDRKVAGVLCEAGDDGVIVAGVGFNVRHQLADFPDDLRDRAVSLQMAAGQAVSRSTLAGALVREMRTLLARAPLRLEGAVAVEVTGRDALFGAEVLVEGGLLGRASGIDAAGRLLVEVAPGAVRVISAGSVRIVGAAYDSARNPRRP
jgi:BirA family biotin operon repressor/biotin-[acetyl-CoA-carboxylase] ligase